MFVTINVLFCLLFKLRTYRLETMTFDVREAGISRHHVDLIEGPHSCFNSVGPVIPDNQLAMGIP